MSPRCSPMPRLLRLWLVSCFAIANAHAWSAQTLTYSIGLTLIPHAWTLSEVSEGSKAKKAITDSLAETRNLGEGEDHYLSAVPEDSMYIPEDWIEESEDIDKAKRGFIPRFGKRGFIPRFGKRGFIPRFGKRGFIPRFGKRGFIPRFGKKSSADEVEAEKRGFIPRFGKRGFIPRFGKRGFIPRFGKRSPADSEKRGFIPRFGKRED